MSVRKTIKKTHQKSKQHSETNDNTKKQNVSHTLKCQNDAEKVEKASEKWDNKVVNKEAIQEKKKGKQYLFLPVAEIDAGALAQITIPVGIVIGSSLRLGP